MDWALGAVALMLGGILFVDFVRARGKELAATPGRVEGHEVRLTLIEKRQVIHDEIARRVTVIERDLVGIQDDVKEVGRSVDDLARVVSAGNQDLSFLRGKVEEALKR